MKDVFFTSGNDLDYVRNGWLKYQVDVNNGIFIISTDKRLLQAQV